MFSMNSNELQSFLGHGLNRYLELFLTGEFFALSSHQNHQITGYYKASLLSSTEIKTNTINQIISVIFLYYQQVKIHPKAMHCQHQILHHITKNITSTLCALRVFRKHKFQTNINCIKNKLLPLTHSKLIISSTKQHAR